jgi:hypothetical protein
MDVKNFIRVTINTKNITYTVLESRKILNELIDSLDKNKGGVYIPQIHLNLFQELYHTNEVYIRLKKVISIEVYALTEKDIEFLNKYNSPTYTE